MPKKTGFEHVREFHEKFGHPIHDRPHIPDAKTTKLRMALILEEFREFSEACLDSTSKTSQEYIALLIAAAAKLRTLTAEDLKVDLVEVADALTDINYVTYGAGHCFGVNLDACMEEVQRSNMSKLGADGKPIYDAHGKIMKGPNYSKPNLSTVINAAEVS